MSVFSYRYLPMNVYLGYSFFVLLGLFIGPIEYKGLDYPVLVSYVGAIVILFAVGYVAGASGVRHSERAYYAGRKALYHDGRFFFRFILFLGVISAFVQWYSFISSGGGLSLQGIGESYVRGYEDYGRGQAKIDFFYVVNIFKQAIEVLVLLCALYYYSVMGRVARYSFLFVILTYLLINVVGTGKQKYLGDVVVFLFYSLSIVFAAKRKRFRVVTVSFVVGAVVFAAVLFVEILRQRYSAAGIDLDNIYEKTHPLISWDHGSLISSLVGDDYALPLGMFLGYFTNGLYGLYLSLTLPFEWTFMVGNSYSLGRIAEIVMGADGTILEHTYPYRVGEEYGWGFEKWHSLFSWLASDITFAGVLLLAPLFGFLYARLWLQAVSASNRFAGPLFIYLSLGLVFSFANNQLMHALAGVIVLFVLFAGWLFTGRFLRLLLSSHRTVDRSRENA